MGVRRTVFGMQRFFDPMSDLEIIQSYGTAFHLNFSRPTSGHPIVKYEIFVNDVLNNTMWNGLHHLFAHNLQLSTQYSIKIRAIDDRGNKSGFSNTVIGTTLSACIVPTLGLVSSYNFEEIVKPDIFDSFGTNHGQTNEISPGDITLGEPGKIDFSIRGNGNFQSGQYNSSIIVPDHDSLSAIRNGVEQPFGFSGWFKVLDSGDHALFGKRGNTNQLEYQLTYIFGDLYFVVFHGDTDTRSHRIRLDNFSFPVGSWVHVTCGYEIPGKTDTIFMLFENDSSLNYIKYITGSATYQGLKNWPQPLVLMDGGWSESQYALNGYIDLFNVYIGEIPITSELYNFGNGVKL